MKNLNPLDELNNQKKFLCNYQSKNYYIRVITRTEDMQSRRDCSELLRSMLNLLEYQDNPLGKEWVTGYEDRIKDLDRCSKQFYTYFVLESEEGNAVGILSGDIYPNNSSDLIDMKPAINMKNFFIIDSLRNKGLGQIMLKKIITLTAKRTGGLSYILKNLSKQSIAQKNDIRYQAYAAKAHLNVNILENHVDFSKQLFFQVDQNNSTTTYLTIKQMANSFEKQVIEKHQLNINKKLDLNSKDVNKQKIGWHI